LRQHLSSWYRPNNAVVVAAGPLQHEQIVQAVQRCLGAWQPAPLPAVQPVSAVLPDGPFCRFVADSDSQISMQLAFRACHRSAPELTTQKILRRLLAGGGCSRLHLA